jgi:hypothetical protein
MNTAELQANAAITATQAHLGSNTSHWSPKSEFGSSQFTTLTGGAALSGTPKPWRARPLRSHRSGFRLTLQPSGFKSLTPRSHPPETSRD